MCPYFLRTISINKKNLDLEPSVHLMKFYYYNFIRIDYQTAQKFNINNSEF